MKIVYRYVTRELLLVNTAILLTLVFVLLCNFIARYLNDTAQGQLPVAVLLKLLLLQLPIFIGVLMPLGLFFGILIVYGRLYYQSEMTVFFVSGLSKRRLLGFTLGVAFGVAAVAAMMTMVINPVLSREKIVALNKAAVEALTQSILPGSFREASGGRVYYIGSTSHDHKTMRHIFVAQPMTVPSGSEYTSPAWQVMVANSAGQEIRDGRYFLVTHDGHRYQGRPGDGDYHVTQYDTYGFSLGVPQLHADANDVTAMSTRHLLSLAHHQARAAAEWQWRLAIPLAVLLLAFLAVPLSRVNPRHGRFVQLLPAAFIAVVYINLLLVGQAWLQDGKMPLKLGLWWVHLMLLLCGLWCVCRWLRRGKSGGL